MSEILSDPSKIKGGRQDFDRVAFLHTLIRHIVNAAFAAEESVQVAGKVDLKQFLVCLHDMIIPSELARGDSNSTLGLCKHYLDETYDLHHARLRIDNEALQMRVQNVLDEAGACDLVVRLLSVGGPIEDMKAAIQLGVSMLKGEIHAVAVCE